MSEDDPVDEEADRRIRRDGFNPFSAVALIALLALGVFILYSAFA